MNPTFKKWEILNINMNNVHIGEENKMKVKKRTLLLLASIVWLIAGFNIIRIGILSYTAVSYTHLDVYKRQQEARCGIARQ